jgi:hypothetical protein
MAAFSTFIFPLYIGSLITYSLAMTNDAALVVGIFNPYISSEAKNSLKAELKTLFPSACLEKGVFPLPFNCNSYIF